MSDQKPNVSGSHFQQDENCVQHVGGQVKVDTLASTPGVSGSHFQQDEGCIQHVGGHVKSGDEAVQILSQTFGTRPPSFEIAVQNAERRGEMIIKIKDLLQSYATRLTPEDLVRDLPWITSVRAALMAH